MNQNKLNQLNDISWNSASAVNISTNPNINFVLLANLPNSKKIEEDLIKLGWKKIYNYTDPNFNTTTVVLNKLKID